MSDASPSPAPLGRLSGQPTLLIAWRYLGAVRQSRTISLISMISIAGLVLGVAALVTVLSVMNGFDRELRARILGIVPHVTLTAPAHAVHALVSAAEREPGVQGAARFVETGGMLTTGSRVLPVAVFGIDPARESSLSRLPEHMVFGELSALRADTGVVIGSPLAARLGLFPGDRVTLMLPRAVDGSVRPMLLSAELVGLFRLGAEPDHGVVFLHADRLAGVAGLAPVDVRIALDNVYQAPAAGRRLAATLGLEQAAVRDWTARHGELFEAVGMEKTMMGLLLGLIVAVAVFNIVASLAMLVDEKRSAVAILRTLGVTRSGVVRIFVIQGVLIGGVGVIAGLGLGVLLATHIGAIMRVIEDLFEFRLLAGTYFDELPSELRWMDLVWIASGALLVSIGGALYPARRAGAIDPARALHR
ncbi:MAG: FtsX-like permease family protein [Gammaproteobacteria bacterium]|nr:MAG: FtsX-like permease family protein [Gammaproteobacteria bacterium]